MRFISHIRRYSVQILPPVQEVLPGGLVREIVPIYVAYFEQGDLSLEEIEFAERVFGENIPGRTQQMDEVTMTPIRGRLSVFDTEGPIRQQEFDVVDRAMLGQTHPKLERGETWEFGTMQKLVESTLIERGALSGDFAPFVPTPAVAPWPAYNEFPGTPEDLVAVLEAQAHYLPGVLTYERENLNRPEVVELLEERIASMGDEAEEFVQA